jgi:hypothetical protein
MEVLFRSRFPHTFVEPIATRSFGLKRATPNPASITSPAASIPGENGLGGFS